MTASTITSQARRSREKVFSILKIAFGQSRQTWQLLLVTGIGIVAAIVLVCAIPLLSQVSTTAELRHYLNSSSPGSSVSNAEIVVHSFAERISPPLIQVVNQKIDRTFQKDLDHYSSGSEQFSFQLTQLLILEQHKSQNGKISFKTTGDQLQLIGDSMNLASSHLHLLKGQLPLQYSQTLDIAITSKTAQFLHLDIGSILTAQLLYTGSTLQDIRTINLQLHVVGIFDLPAVSDSFWHGKDFQPSLFGTQNYIYSALVSNETILPMLSNIGNSSAFAESVLANPADLYWYHRLNVSLINANNLINVESGKARVLIDLSGKPVFPPYVEQTQASGTAPDTLEAYSNRTIVAQLPMICLILLGIGLTLFFISIMMNLLVERQSEATAIMRARGASRSQIFGIFVTQGAVLCLSALLVGPLIAALVVELISQGLLSPADQDSLNILIANPVPVAQSLLGPACITVMLAFIAMLISIAGTLGQDVLSMRREQARSKHHPLWLRLRLDALAAVTAITGYGFSVYLTNSEILNARLDVLVLPLLTFVGGISLVLGCMLLFFHFFPIILRLAARLATRGRSAPSMLAVAQMTWSPRHSMRMTLLLACSITTIVFTLIFTSTQSQRIFDVAAYQAGSDFNGTFSSLSAHVAQSSTYSHIPGVIAASVGYASSPYAIVNGQDVTMKLLAMDANTFARTAIWSRQDSSQPLASLMQQLISMRASILKNTTNAPMVPAIVDTTAWNTLHLRMGETFMLTDASVPLG